MTDESATAARIAELEADNRRLRGLLEQKNAPGELRHRLRNTVALLRTIIRRSAETERERMDFVAQLEDRLDALSRAQSAADQHGEIELHSLIADELLHYGAFDEDRTVVSGINVHLLPAAGQVFALALHELAVNAVEHGALGVSGRLDIGWTVEGQNGMSILVFDWKEFGGPPATEPARRGFGTEVLTRMLAYALDAATTVAYERDGLRCTIRLPLGPGVGRAASTPQP